MSQNSFNKKATRPRHESANRLIDRIIAARPDLAGAQFVVPFTGNTSVTVMTMDEVFKAPVYSSEKEAFARELALLLELQGRDMGADIAPVTFVDSDGGFYGMQRMRGEALTRETLLDLPAEERARLAAQIGCFNARLGGALSEEKRIALGLRPARAAAMLMPHHVLEALEVEAVYERLSHLQVADRLAAWYADSFDETAQAGRMRVLHADMHNANFLYSRTSGRLAVIDLGAGDVLPAEQAFGLMRRYFSHSFVAKALQAFCREGAMEIGVDDLELYQGLRILRHAPQALEEAARLWRELAPAIAETLDRRAGAVSPPAAKSQSAGPST